MKRVFPYEHCSITVQGKSLFPERGRKKLRLLLDARLIVWFLPFRKYYRQSSSCCGSLKWGGAPAIFYLFRLPPFRGSYPSER